MIKYKYGELPSVELIHNKERLHSSIHKLLCYKEENYEHLDEYYDSVMHIVDGINSLLQQDCILDLLIVLESARVLLHSDEYNHKVYRKLILDAHTIVDKIKTD